jgi:uncharacterized SAM-binding protein YcdF (DUF218 family)
VLGGQRIIAPGPAAVSEWVDANRFFGGIELFQAGKAPLLVFTGAPADGPPGAPSQGETMVAYAKALGVPSDRVVTTGLVRNTEDEAREAALLLRGRPGSPTRILLVTSAYHMPRAQRLFEHAGLAVAPFPVDFKRPAGGGSRGFLGILPSAAALSDTHLMLRELYGRLFYRVMR